MKTFEITYTLKHSNGDVAKFSKWPATAIIEAETQEQAVMQLEDEWWSWKVEVACIKEVEATGEANAAA